MSINILIATIGRPSLHIMLDSLLPQLSENDIVTIVFDAVPSIPLYIESALCKVRLIEEPEKLGFSGHAIRNKYKYLLEETDFVMHADDDDYYVADAFSEIKKQCIDKNTLYIAKMKFRDIDRIIPIENHIRIDNIGTPCGIIPYWLNKLGTWAHYEPAGDGIFYEAISKNATSVVFIDKIIYIVCPAAYH
jgi:hypothetical protein